MARKLSREEVLDSIEEALWDSGVEQGALLATATAVLKELEAEGVIDDREVDL